MAHAIARRSHRRRRHHANPYKAGRGRHIRWHRVDGKFAKRAGGRYLRRHHKHALRSNPVRRRRSHALSRLFANPFHTGRGRKRRLRRLDGRFSKRKGYGRARRHGRHLVKHNPRRSRRRRARFALVRYNPSRKRKAGKRRAKRSTKRRAKRGHSKRRAKRTAKRGKRRSRRARRHSRKVFVVGTGKRGRTIVAPVHLSPVRRTMVGY